MLKIRKVCKVKLVKIITYFFWRWIRHNYFTSLSISLNRKLRIISIQIPILYEHLLSFTKSLRALWIYASLRNAELVRKEEALYLRFFTHELNIRKLWISCCVATGWLTVSRRLHKKINECVRTLSTSNQLWNLYFMTEAPYGDSFSNVPSERSRSLGIPHLFLTSTWSSFYFSSSKFWLIPSVACYAQVCYLLRLLNPKTSRNLISAFSTLFYPRVCTSSPPLNGSDSFACYFVGYYKVKGL